MQDQVESEGFSAMSSKLRIGARVGVVGFEGVATSTRRAAKALASSKSAAAAGTTDLAASVESLPSVLVEE